MGTVARWLAARLERGNLLPPAFASPLAASYASISSRTLARPTALPDHARVVGIGSAVLGGAGKTPVAIAYAKALAEQGRRVVLVGHGYRAHTSAPRMVTGHENILEVGDDAIVAARALRGWNVPVWVGRSRDQTLQEASRHGDVLVVDGLLQTRPRLLSTSVLVVDGSKPLGSGMCLPAGDLRGSASDLFSLCDEVVAVCDPRHTVARSFTRSIRALLPHPSVRTAWLDIAHFSERARNVSLKSASSLRLGLLTLVAHPERVDASLRARAIRPICHWRGEDHGTPAWWETRAIRNLARKFRLDAWIATTKCTTHLVGLDLGCRLLTLEITTRLDPTPGPVVDCPPCVPEDSSCSC